jgi:hypothetical protein
MNRDYSTLQSIGTPSPFSFSKPFEALTRRFSFGVKDSVQTTNTAVSYDDRPPRLAAEQETNVRSGPESDSIFIGKRSSADTKNNYLIRTVATPVAGLSKLSTLDYSHDVENLVLG